VLINRQKQQAKENQSQQALPLQSQITRRSNVGLFYQMGACNWDGVQSSERVGPPFLATHFKSVESGSPSSHDSALSPVCCRSLDSTSTALHPERAHTDRAVGDPCPLVPPSLYSCGPPHLFPPRCFFPSPFRKSCPGFCLAVGQLSVPRPEIWSRHAQDHPISPIWDPAARWRSVAPLRAEERSKISEKGAFHWTPVERGAAEAFGPQLLWSEVWRRR